MRYLEAIEADDIAGAGRHLQSLFLRAYAKPSAMDEQQALEDTPP